MVKRRPSWMLMKDEILLEYLQETGAAFNPDLLYHNLVELGEFEISKRTIRRRLHRLLEEGMVERTNDNKGYYVISKKGREFLEDDDK